MYTKEKHMKTAIGIVLLVAIIPAVVVIANVTPAVEPAPWQPEPWCSYHDDDTVVDTTVIVNCTLGGENDPTDEQVSKAVDASLRLAAERTIAEGYQYVMHISAFTRYVMDTTQAPEVCRDPAEPKTCTPGAITKRRYGTSWTYNFEMLTRAEALQPEMLALPLMRRPRIAVLELNRLVAAAAATDGNGFDPDAYLARLAAAKAPTRAATRAAKAAAANDPWNGFDPDAYLAATDPAKAAQPSTTTVAPEYDPWKGFDHKAYMARLTAAEAPAKAATTVAATDEDVWNGFDPDAYLAARQSSAVVRMVAVKMNNARDVVWVRAIIEETEAWEAVKGAKTAKAAKAAWNAYKPKKAARAIVEEREAWEMEAWKAVKAVKGAKTAQ